MLRLLLSSLVLSCLCLLASAKPSILLFTATAKGAYRHDAIPYAVKVITALGKSTAASRYIDPSVQSVTWKTTNTEDASLFEDLTYLRKFDAIVFAFTTDVDPPGVGTILSNKGATNLFQYIQDGGNFAGIHSATNTLFAYPAYGRLAGAFFTYHAGSQHVRLKSLSSSHPAVSKIDSPYWSITDEMYHMRSDPRLLPSPAHALLTNYSAYPDPGGTHNEGTPQPLSWWREGNLLTSNSTKIGGDLDGQSQYTGGAGRSFITTLGHQNATWSRASFKGHIKGGIAWTLQSSTARAVNRSSIIGTDDDDDDDDDDTDDSSDDGTATTTASDPASTTGGSTSAAGGMILASPLLALVSLSSLLVALYL